MPRWRILIPVAVVLTAVAPTLRGLPGLGPWLPDPWLLLLLVAVPEPPPRLRRQVLLVVLLGALRATVTALPVESCWTGLGLALAVRHGLARQIEVSHLPGAFLAGVLAAAAASALDALAILALGLPVPVEGLLARALGAGLLWALAARPGALGRRGVPLRGALA